MLTLNDGRNELWQWDTGRTLTVDADCSQVHFSNKVFGRSIDVDVADGVAIVPDILLQTDKDLNVWAFVGTAENGYTKISKTFKVNRRNKPADYVFTPPDQTSLEEIKEKIEYLESIQDPDAIKNAVDDYLANNPIMVKETDPTVPEWAKQPTPPDVKIPDKLPNPHSITFTGAVDASYDGSNPVEIKIPDSGGNVDLTGYATEQYVKDYAQPKGEYLTAVPDGYAKTDDIPTKPEDIGAQPSGNYLTEVPSGYATEEFVKNKIAEAELGGEEVDLSGYAQKSELPTKVSQLQNDSGYLTEHQDISGKLDVSALPTAINTALAQAKASGEFDGKDGADGQPGKDGADGAPGEKGDKGDKGDTGATGATGPKGDKGEKGDRGLQGVQGIQGERGEQGQKGDKGDRGEQGIQGIQGAKGETGAQGQKGADGTPATHRWSGTTLYITSASGTSSADLKGEKGDRGEKGDKGADGAPGPEGAQGKPGKDGVDGKSAYAYAQDGGYTGTEEEFAEKLAAESGEFIVNATAMNEDGTAELDKTYTEILEAVNSGKTVRLQTEGILLSYVGMDSNDGCLYFSLVLNPSECFLFYVYPDRTEYIIDVISMTIGDQTWLPYESADFTDTINNMINQKGTPNWQAAEGEPGHILGRTHWVKFNETSEVFPETALSWNEAEDPELMSLVVTLTEPLYVNGTYQVTWNGVKYVCTCFEAGGMRIIGEAQTIDSDNASTGEPFTIVYSSDNMGMVLPMSFFRDGAEEGSVTVRIAYGDEEVVPLPKKYLEFVSAYSFDIEPQGSSYVARYSEESMRRALANNVPIVANIKGMVENTRAYLANASSNDLLYFIKVDNSNGLTWYKLSLGGNAVQYGRFSLTRGNLTIDGRVYDGTSAVDMTNTINSMIDSKLPAKGGCTYYVTISEVDGSYTADKSHSEIYGAFHQGYAVYAILEYFEGLMLPCLLANDIAVGFGAANGNSWFSVAITNTDYVDFQFGMFPDDDRINSLIDSKLSAIGVAEEMTF